jgi:hypothetical protein
MIQIVDKMNNKCIGWPVVCIFIASVMAFTSCSNTEINMHKGDVRVAVKTVQTDSIVINADTTSLRGNFSMADSALLFFDQYSCKIFAFSLNNGNLLSAYSRRGQGPNEMNEIMYGSVVHPADTSIWIFDSANGVYEFKPKKGSVRYVSEIDFSWNKPSLHNYESPSCYNLMEMSDFGVTIEQMNDTTVLLPLSMINRNLEGVKSERYKKGHILGLLNTRTYKVNKLIARYPDYYLQKPTPYFEFFDYTINHKDSLIYVSHAPDSLIYCYNYDGESLHTLGFEPSGVNRDYTANIDATEDSFEKDITHVGVNTGLWYDEKADLLFRTSMTDFATGRVILQAYKNNDLVLEASMPPYFKLLGRYGKYYYGVRFIPIDDGEYSAFVLYYFQLSELTN